MSSDNVRIVEVGPRDGLQNLEKVVATEDKVVFIKKLVEAGCKHIEVTSFVRPDLVPQLADAESVCAALEQKEQVRYSALVANVRGLNRAMAAGIKEVAVVLGASETFNRRNIGKSIDDSLVEFGKISDIALHHNVSVRGYLSTAFWCPYEGKVDLQKVENIAARLLDLGVYEVSLSDTIGKAKPLDVFRLLDVVLARHDSGVFALHLHDTNKNAIANIAAGFSSGIRTFDSSAGGLGGCPFANLQVGNVATEDVVDFFEKNKIATGIEREALVEASRFMKKILGYEPPSKCP